MITFSCPSCNARFEVDDALAGAHVACSECDARFSVPPAAAPDPVPETAPQQDVPNAAPSPPEPENGPASSPPEPERVPESKSRSDAPGAGTSPLEPEIAPRKLDLTSELAEDRPSPRETSVSCVPPPSVTAAPPPPKLSPRQRRLVTDLGLMLERFSDFPLIHLERTQGEPPELYVISYHIRGIERLRGGEPVYRDYHEVEIKLPGTYPRTPPTCRMLTPIFHPNIEPAIICIGDHWTAAERLCDLVVRIGEMIAYQAHNVKSPLDGEAAMWTDLHLDMLPVDGRDLIPPDA